MAQSLDEETFLGLTLSKPAARQPDGPRRQTARPIELRGSGALQWTIDVQSRQTHENLNRADSIHRAASLLGDVYRHAHLFTTHADVTARFSKSGVCHIAHGPPSKQSCDAATAHDRPKSYLIPAGVPCPFLESLGVMTATGHVRKAKYAKFRQINRYLEFVEDVLAHLPETGRIEVVDFGCGLSYLTFALHHLLAHVHGREVRIRGVDRSEAVIQRCQRTAGELRLSAMEFTCGDIGSLAHDGPVHLAVSLHACDTASDDALAQAVRQQAKIILAAPCCQHELFTQLDSDPLTLLARHGILKERFAALATDALRAAVLEQSGYRTQVIEFIDTEHTPKNVLLRAVRRDHGSADPALAQRTTALKALLGITTTRLEKLLRQEHNVTIR